MFTIEDIIKRLGRARSDIKPLPAPEYIRPAETTGRKVCLGVESMKRHITDEGGQLIEGLKAAGYMLAGYKLETKGRMWKRTAPYPEGEDVGWVKYIAQDLTDTQQILDITKPETVIVQDKREWEGLTASKTHDPRYKFTNIEILKKRNDIFKLTVIKDAHHRQQYHRESADEMGVHGWITYYHPRIIHHLAPYTRLEHIVRTYHTVNPANVPAYSPDGRKPCVISGAIGPAYPLRTKLMAERWKIPGLTVLQHPGYSRPGPFTPQYLKDLSKFKISICTTSIYGYALRKIIESTACGCRVITNLPHDEILPHIDGNLTRVHPDSSTDEIIKVVRNLVNTYDAEEQEIWAQIAIKEYDCKIMGAKLANDIETLRGNC